MMYVEMLLLYDEERGIEWAWASLDSASIKAPKGGALQDPIRLIAQSLAPNDMSSPTDAAYPSPSP